MVILNATIVHMLHRFTWFVLILSLLFFIAAGWAVYTNIEMRTPIQPKSSSQAMPANGRYVAFQSGLIDDTRYTTTMLFFARTDTAESESFDRVLANTDIPDATQIIRIDVDTYAEIAKKYDITVPPTFVRVSTSGKNLGAWVAYGRTKSIDAILENTK